MQRVKPKANEYKDMLAPLAAAATALDIPPSTASRKANELAKAKGYHTEVSQCCGGCARSTVRLTRL